MVTVDRKRGQMADSLRRNSDANPYCHTDGHANCHSHANGKPFGDANTNCDPHPYDYSHRDPDVYTHTDRYTDRDSYGNPNINAYSHAGRMCSDTRVLEKSRAVAGQPIAAGQPHLQPTGIAIDSRRTSPWEWIGAAGTPGNRRKAKQCQRRGRKLCRADIGGGGRSDRESGCSASRQWIPATERLHAHPRPLQRGRVVQSTLPFDSPATRESHPDSKAAPDGTTSAGTLITGTKPTTKSKLESNNTYEQTDYFPFQRI
jgi:hypothetical protein